MCYTLLDKFYLRGYYMSISEELEDKLQKIIAEATKDDEKEHKARFVQWIHPNLRKSHCETCVDNHYRVLANDETKDKIGDENHPKCECKYKDVKEIRVGTISNRGIQAPDVYLKAYGKLPDYYITKAEARALGWSPGKDLSKFAPGKMIGGDIYRNAERLLPVKDGRIWYECDVDYEGGHRNSKRLYYSNDGLMFYSPDHGKTFYYVY